MIADLKPYAEYRETGLPWVGQMPEHWDLAPNRAMLRRRNVLVGKRHSEYKLLSLTKGGVIVRDISTGKGKFSADMGTSQEVRKGDLVFCLFDVPETPRTVGLSSHDGMITGAYTVFECSDSLLADYLDCFYRSMDDRKLLSPLYSGLRNTIPPPRFLGTKTPVPPPDEQAAIVRFLNHVNHRIDRTIRAKRKVIALLNEQKQVIIHRAVTRGLDPNVRLKPSGIPWLGEIPEGWDMLLLGRCISQIEQGWSPVAAEGEIGENQWAVLTLSSVRRGSFNPLAIKPVSRKADIPERFEVANGDFLLTRSNTRDRVGDVCIAEDVRAKTIICDLIYRLSIRENLLDKRFLKYQLLAPLGRGQIEKDARGSSGTMPKISQGHIKSWRILLPTLGEQHAIIEHIDKEALQINKVIHRTEHEIDLLREYHTRLIADVVTGKLDVREAAARLPKEEKVIEEPLMPDDEESIDDVDMEVL